MRLRHGFVSNSSSASFIVTIKIERDALFDFFINNIEECFSFYSLKEALEKDIKDLRDKELENEKEKKIAIEKGELENFYDFPWKDYLKRKEDSLKEISRFYGLTYQDGDLLNKKHAQIEYIKVASSALGLKLIPVFKNENNDCWKFEANVTIFNDLDDVPEAMRKIIVACNFHGKDINCEIIED